LVLKYNFFGRLVKAKRKSKKRDHALKKERRKRNAGHGFLTGIFLFQGVN
jgi:hypothetical protein